VGDHQHVVGAKIGRDGRAEERAEIVAGADLGQPTERDDGDGDG
jgi:hypothetical protein